MIDKIKQFFTRQTIKEDNSHLVEGLTYDKPEARNYRFSTTDRDGADIFFDGEKNLGEIGPVRKVWLNYKRLNLRSWKAFIESDVAQAVIGRWLIWHFGSGLKLQSEPKLRVLEMEDIKMTPEQGETLTKQIEERWGVFSKSKRVSTDGEMNLNELEWELFKHAKVGGDALWILRLRNGQVKVELVDGYYIQSPDIGNDRYAEQTGRGTIIRNGVEMRKNGKHVAYWILNDKDGKFEYERIEAYSRRFAGMRVAGMVYGSKARMDNKRGVPLLASVLETITKMDRYKEASVAGAEERAKIAYQIVHDANSDGSNPNVDRLKAAAGQGTIENPDKLRAAEIQKQLKYSTNKQAYNMGIGQEIKTIATSGDLIQFKEFFDVNRDYICAAIGIPPDIAFQKYENSYSSSRASIKDWEHTLKTNTINNGANFKQYVYAFWFKVQVLQNKINAPGFLRAMETDNLAAQDAYLNARWVGSQVPHIDPLKEVEAERRKLGELGKNIPLTTVEQASEVLNTGDAEANMEQFRKEVEKAQSIENTQNVVD